MTDLEKAAQQALDALERIVQHKYPDQRDTAFKLGQIAIDALRAAGARQQAEPVDKALTKPAPQVDKEQAESASLRPKQHDYASYVGYTRALEAYCDSLEQAEPVVLAHNDILRMAREAGWPASVVHPHGPGVDTSGYSALAALERFAALVRADVVASAKKAEPVIDDKPVPDAWHLSGYGMESRVMIGEPSERHRQLFSDIRPMYWHPAQQAEPVAESHKRATDADNGQSMTRADETGNPSF